MRGTSWPTQVLYPADSPEVIASAYYEYNRSFEALASLDGALAHVIRKGETVSLRLAGTDPEALDRAERRLREQLPEPEPTTPGELPIEFSYWTQRTGVSVTTRTVEAPPLEKVRINYPDLVRERLKLLSTSFKPGANGRLMLWLRCFTQRRISDRVHAIG